MPFIIIILWQCVDNLDNINNNNQSALNCYSFYSKILHSFCQPWSIIVRSVREHPFEMFKLTLCVCLNMKLPREAIQKCLTAERFWAKGHSVYCQPQTHRINGQYTQWCMKMISFYVTRIYSYIHSTLENEIKLDQLPFLYH